MLNYHFVTFALCVLDPAAHRLTIVNAGHLPPLRRRGAKIEALGGPEGGLPLGCDAKRGYEQIDMHARARRHDRAVHRRHQRSHERRRRRVRLAAHARGDRPLARRASKASARRCSTTCAASSAAGCRATISAWSASGAIGSDQFASLARSFHVAVSGRRIHSMTTLRWTPRRNECQIDLTSRMSGLSYTRFQFSSGCSRLRRSRMNAMEKVAWTELIVSVLTVVVVTCLYPWLGNQATSTFALLALSTLGAVFLRRRGAAVVVDERDREIRGGPLSLPPAPPG